MPAPCSQTSGRPSRRGIWATSRDGGLSWAVSDTCPRLGPIRDISYGSAPLKDGGCDLTFGQTLVTAETCTSLRETTFKKWAYSGEIAGLYFRWGRLHVGEARSTPLVRAVKDLTGAPPLDIVIVDAPPGVACPAVEAMRGADLAVLVTEPTPFGLMFGVEIIANSLNTILMDNFLRYAPPWLSVLILFAIVLDSVKVKARNYILNQERVSGLQESLSRQPTKCADCLNQYHCTHGCPDLCLANDPDAGEGEFRCRVNRLLALAAIEECAATLRNQRTNAEQVVGGAIA